MHLCAVLYKCENPGIKHISIYTSKGTVCDSQEQKTHYPDKRHLVHILPSHTPEFSFILLILLLELKNTLMILKINIHIDSLQKGYLYSCQMVT